MCRPSSAHTKKYRLNSACFCSNEWRLLHYYTFQRNVLKKLDCVYVFKITLNRGGTACISKMLSLFPVRASATTLWWRNAAKA